MTGSLFAVLSAVSYSLVAIFVRKGLRPGDPYSGVFIGLIANIVLLGLAYAVKTSIGPGSLPLSARGLLFFAAAGFTTGWLAREALYRGIRHIGPGRTAAIKNVNPFVAVFLGVVFLGDRFSALGMVGASLALFGYAVLVRERMRITSSVPDAAAPVRTGGSPGMAFSTLRRGWTRVSKSTHLGYIIASLAAVAFGIGQVFRKLGVTEMPDPFLGALTSALVGMAAFALFGMARGTFGRELRTVLDEPRPYFWLAGTASACGQLSFFLALTYVSVSHVSIIAASDTLLTVILAALVFRAAEGITRSLAVASLAVFGGSVLLILS